MKRQLTLAVCGLLAVALFLTFLTYNDADTVYLAHDPLDPLVQVLQPVAPNKLQPQQVYDLPHWLPGTRGMAVVFETQSGPYQNASSRVYAPLYGAQIVLVVRRAAQGAETIDGWQSLLGSGAVVAIPHYASESGRLAAIALSMGLGAEVGNTGPGLRALRALNDDKRLKNVPLYANHKDSMSVFEILSQCDAAVMWDYQARHLCTLQPGWDIVVPVEGTLTANVGLVYGNNLRGGAAAAKDYLLSDEGTRALAEAGFSPRGGQSDLSAWNTARFLYKPAYRRTVLLDRLNGPATVLERVLMGVGGILLFAIFSLLLLRGIPPGIYRRASLWSMAFILLWLVLGLLKYMSTSYPVGRYLWLLTYLPRHALPLCWYCICCISRYGRLPGRRQMALWGVSAAVLTVFVLTNDLHRLFFSYTLEDPVSWSNTYTYNWGYYLSLLWSLGLIGTGLAYLIRARRTRQQRRQILYALALFLALLSYQLLYVAGISFVIQMEITTTVAFTMLFFIAAAQRERFMGAALLSIPILRHSPYAIAVLDAKGRPAYQNPAMADLAKAEPGLADSLPTAGGERREIPAGGRMYAAGAYAMEAGTALVLEDISALKAMEEELRLAGRKLAAARNMLMKQKKAAGPASRDREQSRYNQELDKLFLEKLAGVRLLLLKAEGQDGEERISLLGKARFQITLCHRRLRLLISSLAYGEGVPLALLGQYLHSTLADAGRLGVEGVASVAQKGSCPPGVISVLLACHDALLEQALGLPGASVLVRLEAEGGGIEYSFHLSQDGDVPAAQWGLEDGLQALVRACGGIVTGAEDDDGVLTRLSFTSGEDGR